MSYVYSLSIIVLFTGVLQSQIPRKSVSTGEVTIDHQIIRYQAMVEETFLFVSRDSVGSVITTSYIVPGQDDHRPVIFLFNGGPGASSSPLHMYAFGPVRLKKGKDTTVQINNDYSLIDRADLVFIDPIGTGLTQVFNPDKAKEYWDVENDAKAFLEIMKEWKSKHQRQHSPVFICGESYGTIRAAEIMSLKENFKVKGVLLFSSLLDVSMAAPVSGNEMPYLLNIPTMAAIAWYHHKSTLKFNSAELSFKEAVQFVTSEYQPALFAGNSLKSAQRITMANKLSSRIGLPVPFLIQHDLRITPEEFEMNLLADQNKRIGKLDGTVTALKNQKPYSSREDPSLVVNTILRGDYVGRYFKHNLGFHSDSIYKGVNFKVNSAWTWKSMDAWLGYYSVLPGLEKAMKEDVAIKLFVAGGLYDLATPVYGAKYLFDHSKIDPSRISFHIFPTGHSIFEVESELSKFSKKVKEFISY